MRKELLRKKHFVNETLAYLLLIRIKENENFCNFTSKRTHDEHIQFTLSFSPDKPTYKCINKNNCATWTDLKCVDNVLFKTPCEAKTEIQKLKIFVKDYENFFEFINDPQSTACSFKHIKLWRRIFRTLKENVHVNVINHNLDQNIFHLKFEQV